MNNAINSGPLATLSEAIAGTNTTKLITPYTAYQTLLGRGLGFASTNLGMKLVTGVISMTAANGTDLSGSATASVQLPSKANIGQSVLITLTANQTLTMSDMTGNTLGTNAGVAWANNMPLFIYAVLNDAEDTVNFAVSRIPSRRLSPPEANSGKTGTANADTQGSFFYFGNPTLSQYDENPCLFIGSFRATKNASDTWTAVTLSVDDGIGVYKRVSPALMAEGHFGASLNNVFLPNGGTAPDHTTQSVEYLLNVNGTCTVYVNINNQLGGGTGAVALQMALPFLPAHEEVAITTMTNVSSTVCYPVIQAGQFVQFYRSRLGTVINNNTGIANVTGLYKYKVSLS